MSNLKGSEEFKLAQRESWSLPLLSGQGLVSALAFAKPLECQS